MACSNFKEIVDEYKTANVNPYVKTVSTYDFQYHKDLYNAGVMKICAAVEGDKLLGFGTFIINKMPHLDGTYGTFESLFVSEKYRKYNLGGKLMNAMFNLAREYECQGMYIGAGVGTKFAKVCAYKFKKVNEVFYKPLWEMKL